MSNARRSKRLLKRYGKSLYDKLPDTKDVNNTTAMNILRNGLFGKPTTKNLDKELGIK